MEKNLLQRKAWLLLCLLALTLLACQKDEHSDLEQADSQATLSTEVRAARAWFERSYPATRHSQGAVGLDRASSSKTGAIPLKPQWDKAWVGKDQVVEVPLEVGTKTAYSANPNATDAELDAQVTRLIVLKDKQGNEFAVLMRIVGEPAYLQKCSYNLTNNRYKNMERSFSGLVLYTYLDGSFCGGWRFEDGTVTKSVAIREATNAERSATPQPRRAAACTVDIGYGYTQVCYHYPEQLRVECYWQITNVTIREECADEGGGGDYPGGGGGGGVPGTNPDPPASPEDPCEHVSQMNNDSGLSSRAMGLKGSLNNNHENGYYMKDGVQHSGRSGENHVEFDLFPNEKITELNHSHHLDDVLAFDPGDISYLHHLYKNGNMENVEGFRYLITIDDHVLSLHITDEEEYKKLAKDLCLDWEQGKKSKVLRDEMSKFFKEKIGIEDMNNLFENPQGDPMVYTAGLAAFFAEQKHGSAISIGIGKYQGDTVVWEAKEASFSTTSDGQKLQLENRCN